MNSIEKIESAALRKVTQILFEEHKKIHVAAPGELKGSLTGICGLCTIVRDALNSNCGIKLNMLLLNSNKPELTKEFKNAIIDLKMVHTNLLNFEGDLERLGSLEDYIQVAQNIFCKICSDINDFNPEEIESDMKILSDSLRTNFGVYDTGSTKLPNKKPGGV